MLNTDALETQIQHYFGDDNATITRTVQAVWSGFGQLVQAYSPKYQQHLIAKYIATPTTFNHPRGWNDKIASARKLHSYAIERHWYQQYNHTLTAPCHTAKFLGDITLDNGHILLLEDLNHRGFHPVQPPITHTHIAASLQWLAHLHATWLNTPVSGLWDKGNYWHLATRPNEYHAMPHSPLKDAASHIDDMLRAATYQCIIHGDAKVANFCYSDNQPVAAVDFQYIGAGIGVEDVVYFLGSCIDTDKLEHEYDHWLAYYFTQLTTALSPAHHSTEIQAIVSEWSELLPLVWADFQRFLEGWSPKHHKNTRFSRTQTQRALQIIKAQA